VAAAVDDRADVDVELTDTAPEPSSEDERSAPTPAAAAPRMHTHPYPVPPSHDWTPHDPSLVHVHAPLPLPAAQVDPVSAPAANPAPESEELPHFTIAAEPFAPSASHAAGDHDHGGVEHAGDARGGGGADDPPAAEQSVSTPARLLHGAPPAYPPAARSQGVEADVPLELVVSQGGAVESARVVTHAGFGFDEAAVDAVRGYRFSPAVREGRPTRVRMRWTMQFRLR
jgi:TonB family protein